MPALPDAEELLTRATRQLGTHSPYAEVMAERSAGRRIRFDKTETRVTPEAHLEGAVFRAWAGDAWVEAASSGLDHANIQATVESLERRLSKRTARAPPPGPSADTRGERATETPRPLDSMNLDDMRATARRFYDVSSSVAGIQNTIVTLEGMFEERLFLSTAGARVRQRVDRTRATVVPIAMENGKVEYDYLSEGRTGGWEVLDRVTDEKILATAKEAKRLLTAPAPPTGSMPVLLDPSTAGTFAHESFGHGTEADQIVRQRSYLGPLLGQTVGPEYLTLVDDGSVPNAWGSVFFDDEGNSTRRTVLIDHGRFVEVLHDRVSAAALGRHPTGNTRRADFLSRPYVRMTNTFVEPGDWTLEELLEEAKTGVVLESCTSGIEDPLGGQMQIKTKKAHRIVNGQVGEVVGSMALSGKVLDFLKSIRGIGRSDSFEISPGYCGKGHTDLLPAGTGGSFLLSEAVVGPA